MMRNRGVPDDSLGIELEPTADQRVCIASLILILTGESNFVSYSRD